MNARNQTKFTPLGLVLRICFALVLVLLTFNPSGYSLYHWLKSAMTESSLGPEHLLAGIVLTIGWAIYLRATFRALGTIGLVLAAVLIGALVWLLTDLGWLAANSAKAITWISLICLAVLLGIGMSWSHVRRRFSGQYDVDDV